MPWIIYLVVAVLFSGIVGWHISRFEDAADELTLMLAGGIMGLANGLLIGYGTEEATGSIFWANLFAVLLGLVFGLYYGRGAGLFGSMAGAGAGVIGGIAGALLGSAVRGADDPVLWTAVLLGGLYVLAMIGLIVVVEQATPDYAAYHRLAPIFDRSGGYTEAAPLPEEPEPAPAPTPAAAPGDKPRRLVDYYAFLGVSQRATMDDIWDAYDARILDADEATVRRAELARTVLTDPAQRRDYDRALAENRAALAAYQGTPGAAPIKPRKAAPR